MGKSRLAAYLIVLAILFVYVSFLTKNYYWDGVSFAQTIEDAQGMNASLIHPNHLIYLGTGYFACKSVQKVAAVRSLETLQIVNCLLSALAAFVLLQVLRSTLHSPYISSALTLLFAFSAT